MRGYPRPMRDGWQVCIMLLLRSSLSEVPLYLVSYVDLCLTDTPRDSE